MTRKQEHIDKYRALNQEHDISWNFNSPSLVGETFDSLLDKYNADEHLNNITLKRWDILANGMTIRGLSLAEKVCMLKRAAIDLILNDPIPLTITLDTYGKLEVEEVHDQYSPLTIEADGMELIIFQSHEAAGADARKYWEDMAQDDPTEFACLVGEKTLVSWALNQSAGPGSTKVRDLEDWLDLWLDTPEEHHARYDGHELQIEELSPDLLDYLGWKAEDCKDAVAYRS